MALIAVSCSQSQPAPPAPAPPTQPAPTWPDGTCLAAGQTPIATADVERIAAWIELFDPGKTPPAYKRLALTSTLLHRAVLADRFPEERANALAAATARLAEPPASAQAVDGGWVDLGLTIWGETRDLPLDRWAGPFEDVGRFLLLRPTAAYPGKLPGADEFNVEILEFPYVPEGFSPEALQSAVEATQLTIIDPAIGDLVPAMWRYWMHASR